VANTYTSNAQLAMPAAGDRTWNVAMNGNSQLLDAIASIGPLCVITHEVPSTTLDVVVGAGSYRLQGGAVGTYSGSTSFAVTTAATNYLYLDLTASGALAKSTTAFPSTAHVRLAIVVAGATAITSITDARLPFGAVGSWLDGVNLILGTTSGTEIGTATTQKLGFYGATPVVQPTVGSGTAGTSWTTNEQGMLQRVYNAVRALGLGS
jgi:hypothetical protein